MMHPHNILNKCRTFHVMIFLVRYCWLWAKTLIVIFLLKSYLVQRTSDHIYIAHHFATLKRQEQTSHSLYLTALATSALGHIQQSTNNTRFLTEHRYMDTCWYLVYVFSIY